MKDLESYQKHNSEYNSTINDFEYNKKILEKYKEINQLEILGFKKAIDITKGRPKTHIDIGSGTGWLLNEMSEHFEEVIGIEPSRKATDIAKKLINKENIVFINEEMINGLNSLPIEKPVFLTTSTVLNHIKDFYVKEFLELLNSLPNNSVLYFDERYGKNIQWPLWYVRSKNWWASNLKEWDLTFFELKNNGYRSGIYGIKVGKDNIRNNYEENIFEKVFWKIQGVYYKTKRFIIDKIKNIIKK